MKIINKQYNKWSAEMRKRLRSLSLREASDMCEVVRLGCDTFVAFEDNTIVGWAIFRKRWRNVSRVFMVYVRKSCRRSGVGKRLLERAGKKYGPMSVIGWDFNSNSFFARLSNRNIMIIDKDQVK